MNGSFIHADSVRVKRGGRLVLEIPCLKLSANKVTILQGDNGAGKSTFLLAAAGLIDLKAGKIELFGMPFHKARAPAPRPLRRRLSIVLQDPYLFRGDARSNILHGLKLYGIPRSERQARASWAISMLGIDELADRDARQLSGGERKLVALARAIALQPKGLLLDEVTASLDESAKDRVLAAVEQLVEQFGMSVVMATHIHSLAHRLGAESVRIVSGSIPARSRPIRHGDDTSGYSPTKSRQEVDINPGQD